MELYICISKRQSQSASEVDSLEATLLYVWHVLFIKLPNFAVFVAK